MAPKKTTQAKNEDGAAATEEKGTKRKEDDVKAEEEEQVEQDKDEDEAEQTQEPPTKKAKVDKDSFIDWLLSDEALELAYPPIPPGEGEIDSDSQARTPPPADAGKTESKDEKVITFPHASFTPYQNLVASLLLSKPISHNLQLRTLNTFMNPPFSLTTLEKLDQAGHEGRRNVLWHARTQHKEKTATQLGDLVEGVRTICGGELDDELKGLREKAKKGGAKEVEAILSKEIKGFGPTTAALFLRRVQQDWEEVFPYVDEKALGFLKELGVANDGEALKEKVGGDRGKFVRVLDAVVGLGLEKKLDEVKESKS